ncbi:MAG: outer membrane protein assembly factor BamD, partial [Nitrospinota bacterium]
MCRSTVKIVFWVGVLLFFLVQCAPKTRLPPLATPSPPQPAPRQERFVEQDFQRAEALYRRGEYTKALEQYKLFLLTYPSSRFTPRVRYRIGEILYRQKAYAQSAQTLQQFVQAYPQAPEQGEARYLLALDYYYLGKFGESRRLLEQLFPSTTDPDRQADLRYYIALNLLKEGKDLLALEQLFQLLSTAGRKTRQREGEELIAQIIDERLSPQGWEQVKQRYGGAAPFDRILLRLVEQALRQQQPRKAQRYLQEFLSQFPDQAQAPRVQQLARQLETLQSTLVDRTKIGILLPFSGEGSFVGESAWQGIQLALQTTPYVPEEGELQLITRDTGGNPERVAQLLQELVTQERVIAVIGPLFSRVVTRIIPLVNKLRIPLITPFAPDGNFPAQSPYVFRNSLTNRMQAQALAQYSRQHLGLSRFAVLFPEDPYGQELQHLFRQFVTQLGGEVVMEVSYDLKTTDFTAPIRELGGMTDEERERQGLPETPLPYEAIFIPDYYDKVGQIAASLAFYNLQPVQLLGANGWNDPRLISLGEQHVEGAVFVDGFFLDSPYPHVREFVQNFQSTFNQNPDILAAQAY